MTGERWLRSIRRFAAIVSASLVFGPCFVAACLAASAPPAAVPGQFGVNATGAATYAIPIAIPPGTAGMVPNLSLDYASQGDDGVLGIGWSIAGLTSITRCARTIAQDGIHGSVNYDANDRFCLNGQRLVLISGTYGADGSEYRTEIESFTRVVAHGTAGSGPAWFELHDRSGEAEEIGNTTDSRILAVGRATARIWAVDKVYDTKGNYFAVSYVNDATNGQFYPSRIDYTGHGTPPVLSPYNSVQFTYTTRGDTTPFYQAGSLMKTTVLLTDVKTFTGATLVHDYKLAYLPGTTTAPSRLGSVTLCDAAANCLPATTFGWQGSLGTLTTTAAPISLAGTFAGTGPSILPGAYNGDGLTDFLVQNPGGSACPAGGDIYVGTASGFAPGNFTNGSGTPYCPDQTDQHWSFPEDIDGDGLTDILTTIQKGTFGARDCCLIYTMISRDTGGTSFADHSTPGGYAPAGVGDFNGDGHGDYLSYDYSTNVTQIMQGDGTGSFTATPFPGPTTALPNIPVLGDFDGDGCTDELSLQVYLTCAPAVSSFAQPSAFLTYPSVVGDFNGDGTTDILYYKSGAAATLFLSTGTGFVQQTFAGGTDWDKYAIYVGDWNGDGKMDLLLVAPGGTGKYGSGTPHQLWLSTGTGFVLSATLPNSAAGVAATVADWNSDGADDIWLQQQGTLDSLVTLSYVPDMLNAISNGMGAVTTIGYDRINRNGAVYTKGSGAAFPTQDVDGPIYVVTQVDTNDGLGTCVPVAGSGGTNCFTTTYAYAGAKSDLQGRGFLGYSTVTTKDLQSGIVTATNYRTDFPYIGPVASRTAVTTLTRNGCVAGKTLQSLTNTYTATNLGGTRNLVLPQQTVSAPGDCDGSALAGTTTVHNTYDAYGNPLVTTVTLSDGSSVTTTDTFSNDAANWFIGRMTGTTVTKVVGASTVTRHASFAFDAATGLMTAETIEPGTVYAQQTVYAYDAFGHRITATVSGAGGGAIAGIANHVTGAGYDAIGQFQISATGADGYAESFTYDARFGTPATHTDVNGLVTSWSYDGFGRRTKETRPDGTFTVYSYPAACGGTCPGTSVFEARAVPNAPSGVPDGPSVAVYTDALGREVLRTTDGFAQPVNVATAYDANGNVRQKSRPYFTGGTVLATRYVTDDLGRAVSATAPDGGVRTAAYHGLSVTTTNPLGQATTTLRNAQGLVASVTDAMGHATRYVYDAYGNLITVTDALGNVTTATYDVRGNKVSSTDPDLGHWSYGYDVLGELVAQTDARGQATTLSYDPMGHVTGRVEADLASAWSYGTAAPNLRRLVSETATGAAANGGGYVRSFGYDALSREVSAGTFSSGLAYHTAYDADGRIDTVSYPSGFVAKYVYTPLGYLSQIKDDTTGAVLYTVSARNADLSLTQATAGNGVAQADTYDPNTGRLTNIRAGAANGVADLAYAYDLAGNTTYRKDAGSGVTERFCYDGLNRLTASALAVGSDPGTDCAALGGTVKTIGYDALGNIASKSDVGTYSYPASGPSSVRPHAVASIAGTVNGVTNPSYAYDANGAMTAGAGRTVTMSSFGMTLALAQGTTAVALRYDPEHARSNRTDTAGGATTSTATVSDPGSGASADLVNDGTLHWHDYLQVDGRLVAERFCDGFPTCTGATWRWFVTDHLGSVVAVTDGTGAVVQRSSYDPWGRPRLYATGADDPACGSPPPPVTRRGFTGHERIDSECLLNANARIYDPTLGRFLAADTMISDPTDGQALNRYSYVDNGPLSATDPSGHGPDLLPGDSVTTWGNRAPGLEDFGAGGFYGILNSGGRGTAGSGYGGPTHIAIIRVPVTFNITGTRIPQHAMVPVAVVITEQTEDSDSGDTQANDETANNDTGVQASVPTVSWQKYQQQIRDAGLSLDTSVPIDVQNSIREVLDPRNDSATDGAGSKAMTLAEYTLYVGYEVELMRYYEIDGVASVVMTGHPGSAGYRTSGVGDAGPGAVFELHPHLGYNQTLPSIVDLLTSAKDGIPGVLAVPNASQSSLNFFFYQGRCLDHSKGC